jgi:uncharacterized protein
MKLTRSQARRCLLAHQGLWPPRAMRGKPGVMKFIRRVNCIQYDPINIIGQNPDLVLQSRIAGYSPDLLDELLYQERSLVEGWDKQMAIFPTEDWPFFRRFRERAYENPGRSAETIMEIAPLIREAIKTRGPLSSIDLKIDGKVEWSWAPASIARAAMESMYLWGELVIHHRISSRRVYDFAHNHLPAELLEYPEPNPDDKAYQDWYVLRRLGSAGILWNRSGEAWLGSSSLKSKPRQEALGRLLLREEAFEIQVDDFDFPLYARTMDQVRFGQTLNEPDPAPRAAVIAPLDNLTWDRRFLLELFDFEYRWEVYKPASQRQFGYYVLPVLYGDRFIARFEPVRDKKNGTLVVKNWWWEPGVEVNQAVMDAVRECLKDFKTYAGGKYLELDRPALDAGMDWLSEKDDSG